MLASDAVIVAHRFKFDSDFIFIKTYNVRNTTAMIRMFQCRSCVISICKADWPHYDRVSSFSPLSKSRLQSRKIRYGDIATTKLSFQLMLNSLHPLGFYHPSHPFRRYLYNIPVLQI